MICNCLPYPISAISFNKIDFYFIEPKKYFSYFLGTGAGTPATQISFEKTCLVC